MSSHLQRRDRMIPWYFVIFFAVVAIVNAGLVTAALRTHTGTVTDHPYERGLAYNQVVAAEQQQKARGWRGTIAYANGVLHFALVDSNHHPLTAQAATARFMRPTQEGMDFSVTLTGQNTPITLPLRGLWEVRVEAMVGNAPYQQSQRIVAE